MFVDAGEASLCFSWRGRRLRTPTVCELSPEIRAELTKASKVVANPTDYDQNVAPFLALRTRYPNDLLVHGSTRTRYNATESRAI